MITASTSGTSSLIGWMRLMNHHSSALTIRVTARMTLRTARFLTVDLTMHLLVTTITLVKASHLMATSASFLTTTRASPITGTTNINSLTATRASHLMVNNTIQMDIANIRPSLQTLTTFKVMLNRINEGSSAAMYCKQATTDIKTTITTITNPMIQKPFSRLSL